MSVSIGKTLVANQIKNSAPSSLMDISPKSAVLPVSNKSAERSDSHKRTFQDELAPKKDLAERSEKPQDLKDRTKADVERTTDELSRSASEKMMVPTEEVVEEGQSGLELRQLRRESLKPLKLAANKNGEIVQDVPVIAFLKGQLEKLEPKDIPSLISSNQFIAGALEEGDIGAYLNKEMPVDKILEALTIPNSVVQESIAAGLDLKQVVTPADMLRSLGVDPSRVQAELTNLKNNLQSKGVSGYMQKAAMLKGLQPNQLPEQDLNTPIQNIPVGELPNVKNPFAQTSQIAINPIDTKLNSQPQKSQPVQPVDTSSAKGSPVEMGSTGLAKAITVPVPSDLNQTQQSNVQPFSGSPVNEPPKMHSTDVDPMVAMQRKMQSANVVSIDVKNMGTTPDTQSTSSVNAGQILQNNQMMQQNLGKPEHLNYQNIVKDAAKEDSQMMASMKSPAALATAATVNKQTTPTTKTMSIDELQLDTSKFSLSRGEISLDDSKEDSSQNSSGDRSSFLGKGSEQFFANLSTERSESSTSNFADFTNMKESNFKSESLPTSERAQLVQNIMDKATSMIKNGGGSINLNLDHIGLGSLQMAVNLKDERVDLKIMTSSDRVRDLVANELAGLRDALSVQKLDLGSVDVGIEGKEGKEDSRAFQNNDQQQQRKQFQEQLAQDFGTQQSKIGFSLDRDYSEIADGLSDVVKSFNRPMNYRSNGHIEVRV